MECPALRCPAAGAAANGAARRWRCCDADHCFVNKALSLSLHLACCARGCDASAAAASLRPLSIKRRGGISSWHRNKMLVKL
jgi:hypothetical protein